MYSVGLRKTLSQKESNNMKIERENFWDTIEEWTDPSAESGHFFGNSVGFHDKILEESKTFDGWSHTFDGKNFSDELKYNLTTLSGSTMDRWEHLERVQFSKQGEGIAEDDEMDYWWTVPQEKDFPTVYKFMDHFPRFKNPVISKLGAGHQLLPHDHGPAKQFLYNMSLNEPEGSRTAIYPQGELTVKPGDIYKLDVHNLHAVKNGNETRYHILFQGGRY